MWAMAPTTSTLDRVQNDGSLCGNEIAQKGQNDGYTLTSVTSAVSRPLFSNPFSHMWGLKGRTKIVRGPRCLLNWNPNLSPSTASNAAICNSINSPKEPRNSSSNSSSCVLSSSALPHHCHRPPWVAFQPEIHHPFGAVKGFKLYRTLLRCFGCFGCFGLWKVYVVGHGIQIIWTYLDHLERNTVTKW